MHDEVIKTNVMKCYGVFSLSVYNTPVHHLNRPSVWHWTQTKWLQLFVFSIGTAHFGQRLKFHGSVCSHSSNSSSCSVVALHIAQANRSWLYLTLGTQLHTALTAYEQWTLSELDSYEHFLCSLESTFGTAYFSTEWSVRACFRIYLL